MANSHINLNHLYLFGPPASGKSTVFAELTRDQTGWSEKQPIARTRWLPSDMVELGVRRESFSGTDALAMNAINAAEAYVNTARPPRLIAEGDRLAVTRWFLFTQNLGYRVWLFYLDTPEAVLADRRAERALLGAGQDRTWVKGRETKAANTAAEHGAYHLDGSMTPAQIVKDMLRVATPFQASYIGDSAC